MIVENRQQRVFGERGFPCRTARKENPPPLGSVLITILLPPFLMLGRSVVELAKPVGPMRQAIDFVGDPITALLIALFFAIVMLGLRRGWSAGKAFEVVGNCASLNFSRAKRNPG
jgi:gluconate:H+ symporter, GntP family